MTKLTGIAPSILAADFARLGSAVEEVMNAGARVIHVDVMDGHFVAPITMGPLVVEALAPIVHEAEGFLDVHLMIENPQSQIAAFAKAGADVITVHSEAASHLHYTLQSIRAEGCKAGVSLCPATPIDVLAEIANDIDLALCMSVNPGWGGQPFIASSLDKMRRMRAILPDDVVLEVDGGIDKKTVGLAAQAGASLLVAGSAVFGADNPAQAYQDLAALIQR